MSEKQLKYSNFVGMSLDELSERLVYNKKALLNLRFRQKFADLKDTSLFSKHKTEVSRIHTEITKRKQFSKS